VERHESKGVAMSYIRYAHTLLFCFLLLGTTVFAQNSNISNKDIVLIGDSSYSITPPRRPILYRDGKYFGDGHKSLEGDRQDVNFAFEDRHYRRLFPYEVEQFIEQFGVISKIRVEDGKLFLDGKEIKTRAIRLNSFGNQSRNIFGKQVSAKTVKVRDVKQALYLNGGVFVEAHVDRAFSLFHGYAIGFIDLQKNECIFTLESFHNDRVRSAGINLAFIVPTSLNTSNTDLLLDVQVPDEISRHETLDCVLTLTNNSNRPIVVPCSLLDSLVITEFYENTQYVFGDVIHNPHHAEKYFTYSETSGNDTNILLPSETKKAILAFQARDIFRSWGKPYRSRLLFQWHGLINSDNPTELCRFTIEKPINVNDIDPYLIDNTNTDLLLDVKISESFGNPKKLNCTISLTNKSNKPVLVPNSLFEGLGITQWNLNYDAYITRFSERFPKSTPAPRYHTIKYPIFPEALQTKSTILMPSQTRESIVLIPERVIFSYTDATLQFYWDGLLDPDDNKKISRFTCNTVINCLLKEAKI
jgi:hypothetical protein